KGPAHGKLDVVVTLPVVKRESPFRPGYDSVQSQRVISKNQTKRCVHNPHDHLDFKTGAGSELVRTRNDLNCFAPLKGNEGAVLKFVQVCDSTFRNLELILVRHPSAAHIDKGR